MNNLSSSVKFESSPIASSMMGGRRRRRKRSKKGGMIESVTPEKDKSSRVAPIIEKVPLNDLIDDEKTIENAEDKEYEDLEKQLEDEDKFGEESYKIDINEEKEDEDILDKLEKGESIENSGGGTRRRKRKTKHNKTKKHSKKTKKNKRKGSHKKNSRKNRRK